MKAFDFPCLIQKLDDRVDVLLLLDYYVKMIVLLCKVDYVLIDDALKVYSC